MIDAKATAFDFVSQRQADWSAWNSHIWNFAETPRGREWWIPATAADHALER